MEIYLLAERVAVMEKSLDRKYSIGLDWIRIEWTCTNNLKLLGGQGTYLVKLL